MIAGESVNKGVERLNSQNARLYSVCATVEPMRAKLRACGGPGVVHISRPVVSARTRGARHIRRYGSTVGALRGRDPVQVGSNWASLHSADVLHGARHGHGTHRFGCGIEVRHWNLKGFSGIAEGPQADVHCGQNMLANTSPTVAASLSIFAIWLASPSSEPAPEIMFSSPPIQVAWPALYPTA